MGRTARAARHERDVKTESTPLTPFVDLKVQYAALRQRMQQGCGIGVLRILEELVRPGLLARAR